MSQGDTQQLRETFAKIVYEHLVTTLIPGDLNVADATIRKLPDPTSLASRLDRKGYAYAAISAANTYLASSCNALKTITLLKEIDENGKASPAVTLNGTAALARQSMECAVTAEWLLENSDEESLHQAGFAARWANAIEQHKFAQELNNPAAIANANDRIQTMIKEGTTWNYFSVGGGGQPKLKVTILNSTDLLKRTILDPDIITPEISAHGSGYKNAAWLFRFTSGQTHGLEWATMTKTNIFGDWVPPREDEELDYEVITKPTYTIINLALFTSCGLIRTASRKLLKAKSSPL